eukprot:COSAG01_NODE_19481_length_1007_cov_4.273128_1_plen_147_part_01
MGRIVAPFTTPLRGAIPATPAAAILTDTDARMATARIDNPLHSNNAAVVAEERGSSGDAATMQLQEEGRKSRKGTLQVDGKQARTVGQVTPRWLRQTLRKVEGVHSETIRSVAITADGQTMCLGSDDKTASVIDVASGEVVRKVEGV